MLALVSIEDFFSFSISMIDALQRNGSRPSWFLPAAGKTPRASRNGPVVYEKKLSIRYRQLVQDFPRPMKELMLLMTRLANRWRPPRSIDPAEWNDLTALAKEKKETKLMFHSSLTCASNIGQL